MNLESIKTFILVVLVCISLVFTVKIWNFSSDSFQPEDSPTSRQTSIGGDKLLVKDVIRPDKMIFRKYDSYYQLAVKDSETTLYQEMQQWVIQQFGPISNQEDELQIGEPHLELTFPTELPITIVPKLFRVSENEDLSGLEFMFDQMYFVPSDEDEPFVKVIFASSKHNQTLNGNIYVQEMNPYRSLQTYIENDEALIQLTPVEIKDGKIVYLPAEELKIDSQYFVLNDISDMPLINTLFQDPTAVPTTIRSSGYYTDGARKLEILSIYNEKRYMEYVNPISNDSISVSRNDLINQTINYVNNHDGWTDSYTLLDINNLNSSIDFQLSVNGYPILDKLGKLQITWNNQDVTEYYRPLINLDTPLDLGYAGQDEALPSGNGLITYINSDHSTLSLNQIEDIRIGYRVVDAVGEVENEEASLLQPREGLSLEPSWYVKVNGTWRVINMNTPEQGGV